MRVPVINSIKDLAALHDRVQATGKQFAIKHGKQIEDIQEIWLDEQNNVCVRYTDGSYYHYNDNGEWY